MRPSVRRILDSLVGLPAYVRNGRFDILYANGLAEALLSDLYADPTLPVNSARFCFLNPRGEAGRNPYKRARRTLEMGGETRRSDCSPGSLEPITRAIDRRAELSERRAALRCEINKKGLRST